MRDCRVNGQYLWFAKRVGQRDDTDEWGDFTGEVTASYAEPVRVRLTVAPNHGNAWDSPFGLDLRYERVAATAKMDLDIDEGTLVWEGEPVIDGDGNPDPMTADYKVVAIARGLHHTRYALRRLKHGKQD